MMQIDPRSGKVKKLAFPHLPPDSRVFWPHAIGGDRFFYLEMNGKAQIVLRGGSLTSDEKWDFGPFTSRVLTVGDRILYVRDGALTSRELDRKTMELRGEPKTIIPAIYFYAPLGIGGFAVSDKTLVHLAPDVDAPATWYDRHGRELGTIGPPAVTGGAFLSRAASASPSPSTTRAPRPGTSGSVTSPAARRSSSRQRRGPKGFRTGRRTAARSASSRSARARRISSGCR